MGKFIMFGFLDRIGVSILICLFYSVRSLTKSKIKTIIDAVNDPTNPVHHSVITRRLEELIKNKLVYSDEGKYGLTTAGVNIVRKIVEIVWTLDYDFYRRILEVIKSMPK